MRLNFKRFGLLCGRAARACAKELGLTVARVDLLALLLRHELPQVDLAAILCVTEPVVSVLVRILEEQGWLQRRHPPGNRRIKLCSLTSRARAFFAEHLNDFCTVDPEGRAGAQCVGESAWLSSSWAMPLRQLGINVDPVLDIQELELPFFRAMQTWNKCHHYEPFSTGPHGYGPSSWPSTYVEAQEQYAGRRDQR